MAMTTTNPALRETIFDRVRREDDTAPMTMTIRGTAIKTGWLLGILLVAAGFVWWMSLTPIEAAAGQAARFAVQPVSVVFVGIGFIGGLILALITIFRPRSAPWSAPIYSAFQGLALGGISAWFETIYPGIVLEAVTLTFGVLAVMLGLYAFRIVQATAWFRTGVIAATGAIALVYIIDIVLRFFGVGVPFIHETGWVGIGFSLFVVTIAALNLILDFDLIEQYARRGAPLYMEWYGGFALMVTLVWLYLEILRLLSKLRSRS